MPVYWRDNEDFVGFVVRACVAGNRTQKYYSIRTRVPGSRSRKFLPEAEVRRIEQQAHAEDSRLMQLKHKAAKSRERLATPTCRAKGITGIRGISLSWVDRPKAPGQKPFRGLRFQINTRKAGVLFVRSFTANVENFELRFKEAVRAYCKFRGLAPSYSRYYARLDKEAALALIPGVNKKFIQKAAGI